MLDILKAIYNRTFRKKEIEDLISRVTFDYVKGQFAAITDSQNPAGSMFARELARMFKSCGGINYLENPCLIRRKLRCTW